MDQPDIAMPQPSASPLLIPPPPTRVGTPEDDVWIAFEDDTLADNNAAFESSMIALTNNDEEVQAEDAAASPRSLSLPVTEGDGKDCYICMHLLDQFATETRENLPDIIEKEYAIRTPCRHLFGRFCLHVWLATNCSCLSCRDPLTNTVLFTAFNPRRSTICVSMELKIVGGLQEQGPIRDESMLYGINPSHGFFKLNGRTHFIPEGRYVASYLSGFDGRIQFRADDQMVFNRPIWFTTSDIGRALNVEEPTRVITNLIDDTQCWEILSAKSRVTLCW
jgi:hypothetical protein